MSTKVWVRGNKQPIILTDQDFVTEGGEGKIYAQNKTIFKIQINPKDMPPEGKILKLQALTHPYIIKPDEILVNDKGRNIGYTMKKVTGEPLARFFTNDFRKKIGFDNTETKDLILKLREGFEYLHQNQILVVDANENNFMVNVAKILPYFIDTCSYQVPGYPATAITPNIRDYSASSFSELSDWFAFAILVSQLFVGIHPFKGSHPDYKKNDLEGRMKNNVSFFNKKVSLPSAVRDFNLIPKNYRQWLEEVLNEGKRLIPPADMIGAIAKVVTATHIIKTSTFDIAEVNEFNTPIVDYRMYKGNEIITFGPNDYIVNKLRRKFSLTTKQDLIFEPTSNTPYLVGFESDKIQYVNFNTLETNTLDITNNESFSTGSHIVSIMGNKLNIMGLKDLGETTKLLSLKQWDVLPHATKAYNGFLYSNMLGQPYIMVFDSNTVALHRINVKELIGYKVIDGKYENHVAVLICERKGEYFRFTFKFSKDFDKYVVVEKTIPDNNDINFTVLDNGIVVFIHNDHEINIFSNNPDNLQIKTINNDAIKSNMRLTNNGSNALFYIDKKLYKISLK